MKFEIVVALLFIAAGITVATVGAASLFGPAALVVIGIALVAAGVVVPWERM